MSPDKRTCYTVAVDAVFCTFTAVRCRNWMVVACCDLIIDNSTSAASFSTSSWSICACTHAVGGRGGAGVDLRLASFLPLLGPARIDRVTEIAPMVIRSSLGEVGASAISGLGPLTLDAIKLSASYCYLLMLAASSIASLSSSEAWSVMRLNMLSVI